MADKMMRIAGRTSAGTAVAMSADASGNVGTTRKWKKEWINLHSSPLEIRDTSALLLDAYDVSDIPLYSLRVLNRLKVPITLSLRTDVNTTNGYRLVDKDGVVQSITIPYNNDYFAITPEDWPILNYIRYLRITIKAQTAPTEGSAEVSIVPMR